MTEVTKATKEEVKEPEVVIETVVQTVVMPAEPTCVRLDGGVYLGDLQALEAEKLNAVREERSPDYSAFYTEDFMQNAPDEEVNEG